MTVSKGDYHITTDKHKIDIDLVHAFLSRSYWAEGISKDIVAQSVKGALCFGVFFNDQQVGFARMITDEATFAYLADVFIVEHYRGQASANG